MKNQLLTIILHLPLLAYAQQHDMNNMPAKKMPIHTEQKNKNKALSTTVRYDLYDTGRFRAQLERKDMPIATLLFFDGRVNSDKEYTLGLRYFLTRTFSIGTLYDSDYGAGAGIGIRY